MYVEPFGGSCDGNVVLVIIMPSKVVLEGYVVVEVEMLLVERRYSLGKL